MYAPEYFCIAAVKNEKSEASKEFLDFIYKIRNFRGVGLCVDMSKVGRMVANATLLFKAELSYLFSRGVKISGIPPRKKRTHQVLIQTGIAKMIGVSCDVPVDREDVIHWRQTSGVFNIAEPDNLDALLNKEDDPLSLLLYTGMIESVNNCIEHAYDEHPHRRIFKDHQEGWWGFQQFRDGVLTTCICDLGIGISNSLPITFSSQPSIYLGLISLFKKYKGSDVQSILAAIEYGKSRTGKMERGKGLRDAHKVIDQVGEGIFQLMSNRGLYVYRRGVVGGPSKVHTRTLQRSIAGTIYQWSYPLKFDNDGVPVVTQGATL